MATTCSYCFDMRHYKCRGCACTTCARTTGEGARRPSKARSTPQGVPAARIRAERIPVPSRRNMPVTDPMRAAILAAAHEGTGFRKIAAHSGLPETIVWGVLYGGVA